jgi:hypothetical protein
MKVESHPQAGEYFRINVDNGRSQAGYDQMLHGNLVKLLNWADGMDQDANIPRRKKDVALTFYAHRCLPDLDVTDPTVIPLDGLVYGSFKTKNSEVGFEEYRFIAVVREAEL